MRTMRAVLGDYYHCSDQLLFALRLSVIPSDIVLTVTRYPEPVDPSHLAEDDLLFLASMGQWNPRESDETWYDAAAQQTLSDHIAAGAGCVIMHSGTASHPARGPLHELCGGRFLSHSPEHLDVTVSPVSDHPITAGVTTFTHPDEYYFMEIDPDVTQLLTATSTLGEQSAGWCRSHGSGRVAVIVPGHTSAMLTDPMMRQLLTNTIQWALSDEN